MAEGFCDEGNNGDEEEEDDDDDVGEGTLQTCFVERLVGDMCAC